MKDFRMVVKLRNNQLMARREALGLSAPEFAVAAGVNYSHYIQLESLKKFPINRRGEWNDLAHKLAAFHRCLPEDLFTEAHAFVRKRAAAVELSAGDMAQVIPQHFLAQVPGPEDSRSRRDLKERVGRVLASLTPREEEILRRRFGLEPYNDEEQTLEETATSLGDGTLKERIRQIEAKALRKLRTPSRSKQLKAFVEG